MVPPATTSRRNGSATGPSSTASRVGASTRALQYGFAAQLGTSPMAYLRQAMIAQHQGDLRKASMLAKKAQSEDPNLEDAHAFLTLLTGG